MSEITQILSNISDGEDDAKEQLLTLVYDELRRIAQSRVAALSPGQTLHATALVNEAYLKLFGGETVEFANRAHFFGAAARAMKNLLVDELRRKQSLKRGGALDRTDLTQCMVDDAGDRFDRHDLHALDEALRTLEKRDPQRAQVVMLRFFCGLTIEQVALALDVSTSTVDRHWTIANAWLRREMASDRDA